MVTLQRSMKCPHCGKNIRKAIKRLMDINGQRYGLDIAAWEDDLECPFCGKSVDLDINTKIRVEVDEIQFERIREKRR